jgi:DNA-binding transcriptional regulator GbsR (MarR family)
MSSPAITSVIKIMESLPIDLQDGVAEHLKEYIDELQDETKWSKSFQRTQPSLIAAAKKAKQEIAAGMVLDWQP